MERGSPRSDSWNPPLYLYSGQRWEDVKIRYLLENLIKLDDKKQGEVRNLAYQYKLDHGMVQPRSRTESSGSILHDMAGVSSSLKISEKQIKRLWAIGKTELQLTSDQIKAAQKKFGFERTEDISSDKYEAVLEEMRAMSAIAQGNRLTRLQRTAILNHGSAQEPVYKTWATEADAIQWAHKKLPSYSLEWLNNEFAALPATNGKKALAWIEYVDSLSKSSLCTTGTEDGLSH